MPLPLPAVHEARVAHVMQPTLPVRGVLASLHLQSHRHRLRALLRVECLVLLLALLLAVPHFAAIAHLQEVHVLAPLAPRLLLHLLRHKELVELLLRVYYYHLVVA